MIFFIEYSIIDFYLLFSHLHHRRTLRTIDFIECLGGDEFILVAEEITDIYRFEQRLELLIEEIRGIDFLKKYKLPFGASIGAIYGAPRSYTSAEVILYYDELMYKAKRAGKGRHY